MADTRVGLIGYGGWARTAYVPALQRDGRAQLAAVAAKTEATRQRARDELGDGIEVFESAAELLKTKPDAAMIAVPDEVPEETLIAALDAGAHVYYEPPVAHKRDRIRGVLKRLMAAPQIT